MVTLSIYERLSNAISARVEGYLKNGRYHLTIERYYAVIEPLPVMAFENIDEMPLQTPYKKVLVSVGVQVDYYVMRDDFDRIVMYIKQYLDKEYERELERINSVRK